MMCFGWRPGPQDCYRDYLYQQGCPSVTWFLVLAAAAGAAALTKRRAR